MRCARFILALFICGLLTPALSAQEALPLRQSSLEVDEDSKRPPTLREATRDDRWLGLPPREVRFTPDSRWIYFRWNEEPEPGESPDTDPWYRVDRLGDRVERVPNAEWESVPGEELKWSPDGQRAAWVNEWGRVFLQSKEESRPQRVYSVDEEAREVRFFDRRRLHFLVAENLWEYDLEDGSLRQLTRRFEPEEEPSTEAARHLSEQQKTLFEVQRRREREEQQGQRHRLAVDAAAAQALPACESCRIEDVRMTPDRRWIVYRLRQRDARRQPTRYIDFTDPSGYASVEEARPKVGEPRDVHSMRIVRFDTTVAAERINPTEVKSPEAGERGVIIYGPWWDQEGLHPLVQVVSLDHKDRWISRLRIPSGTTEALVHDHDEAWLGGPEPIRGYLQPALLEPLTGGRFVFASERSGWSHLYLYRADGTLRPLTEGEWEVRHASLSADRRHWLIAASRQHPCDDHLYLLPREGGELRPLVERPGRAEGFLSPDGGTLAFLHSDITHLPDLWLRQVQGAAAQTAGAGEGAAPQTGEEQAAAGPTAGAYDEASVRVTVSGTDHFHGLRLVEPEVVSFQHPDGGPLWAQLYKPAQPHPAKPGAIHVHGGGYRQFSHRGWSVYGWASHIGFIQYLLSQGYTVLDFDYRGSAGFGRDYRTDIYRSMGVKDVQGGVAAAQYLAEQQGVDSQRIGLYGLSYGGFFTLSALFKHPGVFAAGVANAAVADWAHYNHVWTSRILNLPYEDEEAYRVSSPIYHAGGLQDPLLIVHGLIDDNVQFQDAARLVQRLIEMEKDFEVMFYPSERHVIEDPDSRLDYRKRVRDFFGRHLLP
ncbi:MAG TPA: prolyl oligopeptidase family serine peptidase [Acidobacteriota bacterium]|nr:prolyl oligopeptidase family serine peptidase [Acidobacteriota bacterium]